MDTGCYTDPILKSLKVKKKKRERERELKKRKEALTGVAQCIECWPANQKVANSIPSQGTCLGCGQGPWLGAHERQPINISLAR